MNANVTVDRVRVRYAETDQMGHAYYANYLVWFEQARTQYFRDRGLPYSELEERGYKLPVVEVYARYRGEAKYDDELEITVSVSEIKRAALKIDYQVHNKTRGGLITEGYTWHVLVGPEFKAATIPEFVLDVLGREPQAQP